MLTLLLLCGLLAADITQLTGDKFSGELTQWQGTQLTFDIDGTKRQISTEELLNVEFHQRPDASVPANRVTLVCGSNFSVSRFTSKNGKITAERLNGLPITFPQSQLRSIRFREPSDALDTQWNELVRQPHEGDAIVIRKGTESLDYLEGLVGDVTEEQLTFTMDGDEIDVPLHKLEGFAPYRKSSSGASSAICQVTTVDGENWKVSEIAYSGGQFTIKTASGATTQIAGNVVARIGFAAGNVVYLSDQTPTRVNITPLVAGDESPSSVTTLLYAPIRDESFDGTPLMLRDLNGDTQSYPKGWAIHSRTEITFRLDGEHRKLRGLAGLDPTVSSAAAVKLLVLGNETELLSADILAGDAPLALDVDIANVKRLKIIVDYGDGVDLGDRLHLCNLRTTK
jgi:hypothetical protein